jgi:GNAT superfamily N-acetyltransferase
MERSRLSSKRPAGRGPAGGGRETALREPRAGGEGDRVIEVRAVTPAQWRILRDLRLAALKEAPYAFASTFEREAAWGESRWREGASSAAWFTAWRDGRAVGLAAGRRRDDHPPDERHVISMWVEPAARGTGVAEALIHAVAGWAARQGACGLTLWVADSNPRAAAFYRRLGFAPTGARQPLPSNPDVGEAEFAVDLSRVIRAPGAARGARPAIPDKTQDLGARGKFPH